MSPTRENGGPLESADGFFVGSLRLEGCVLLAPMAGVTDAGLRRIARQFGATLAVSEMVAANGLSRGDNESQLRADGQGVAPHAVQIAGCRQDDMAEAARLVEACGADLIDINMGCPAKRVTGGLAGSALMRDLDQAVALIRATVSAVTIPVTVKMRLGWDDASINAPELARRAESEGVRMVTVHARTRSQFYKGQARWAAVRAVKDAVSIPVVINGDCSDGRDARQMLTASGADAVMVGRAAVGQPWIVGDIAHELARGVVRPVPSVTQRLAAAVEHYEALLSALGSDKGNRHARKHLAAYADHRAPSLIGDARHRLVTSDSPREVIDLLTTIFLNTPTQEQPDAIAA